MRQQSNPRSLPPKPGSKVIKAPAHLDVIERQMWRSMQSAHRFDDPASLALLKVAMEAHMRSRRCRQAIDKDGETLPDRFGQIKPHPLLPAERDARAGFLSAMKILGLDLTGN